MFIYESCILVLSKMSLDTCPRVLVGGTLIDGTGAPPINDSIVVMNDEYIVAVGKRDEIPIPDGSEVYDITGKTIMPCQGKDKLFSTGRIFLMVPGINPPPWVGCLFL